MSQSQQNRSSQNRSSQNRSSQKQRTQQPAAIDWPDGAADLDSDADTQWRDAIMEQVHQRMRDQAQRQDQACSQVENQSPVEVGQTSEEATPHE